MWHYDVIVVGGGVVGCAVLYELTRKGYQCLLLEKNAHLVSGASSGNSGMFHTGFDGNPGTVEQACVKQSQNLLPKFLEKHKIPHKNSGAVMIMTDHDQRYNIVNLSEIFIESLFVSGMFVRADAMYLEQSGQKALSLERKLVALSYPNGRHFMEAHGVPIKSLDSVMVPLTHKEAERVRDIQERAERNKVAGVKWLSVEQLRILEPSIAGSVLGGLMVPGEMVVDSCLLAVSLAHQAKRHGAQILCNQGVIGGERNENNAWTVKTENSMFSAKVVVNAAGLYGDSLDRLLIGKSHFSIKPRKGQFVVFEKAASQLLKSCMILPVPSENTKGVIIFPSVYGHLVVGPTAEETDEKENPSNTNDVIESLVAYGYKLLPELRNYKIIGHYAGVRPATEFKDYQINVDVARNFITIGGIRSTGVTACLGIASHVLDLVKRKLQITPSCTEVTNQSSTAICWVTNKPSYVLDGVEYHVTHPLMRMGLTMASKL